jgi:2-hydroxychromene-2-carboxylate isomerase
MSQTIEFYWDAASTYSYLAATQIERFAAEHGATVVWKPFLLGKAFEATGNKMPASVPAKAKYLFKDVGLWAKHYRVPFAMPRVFPLHSVLALRVCIAAARATGTQQFTLALLKAYWAEGQDVSQPETVAALLTAHGLDAPKIMEAATSPEVKDALKANTEEAVARGVFGAPTFFINGQMFWGNDRLPLMAAFLKGELA